MVLNFVCACGRKDIFTAESNNPDSKSVNAFKCLCRGGESYISKKCYLLHKDNICTSCKQEAKDKAESEKMEKQKKEERRLQKVTLHLIIIILIYLLF